ncbi:MAG: VanZ family protein [Deltaproteobacteria bacterium]|nr:VanZ family protein [Deltaproteobacteria bacterium]
MKTNIYAWIPPLIWAAAVFVLSSLPGSSLPDLGFAMQDKFAHSLVFATLAALVLRALGGTRFQSKPLVAMGIAVAIATAYGVSDEFHQSFVPRRSPDVLDVVADSFGALMGVVAFAAWSGRRVHSNKNLEIAEKDPEIVE